MDAPSSTESSLFEGFRLDWGAGVLFRRDEHGVFAPMAIASREPRSWRPSGRERRSKIAT
jgi:hypothetical protein